MSNMAVYATSLVQVVSDAICIFASVWIAIKQKLHKKFFFINSVAFIFILFADAYYNYMYRILQLNVAQSSELVETLPLFFFQILQSYNWYCLLRNQNVKIISRLNLPYLLFSATVTCIVLYFFSSTNTSSLISSLEDIASVVLDLFIWVCTIICLGRTKNKTIAILALGCLMIVSADLTFTCSFMFEMNNIVLMKWPHIIWAAGAFFMALGFLNAFDTEEFLFYKPNSIHVNSSWWLLIASLIAFLIGFAAPCLFIGKASYAIHSVLWDIPISLMFTMMAATLLSNQFSKVILSSINSFSHSIELFKSGSQSALNFKNNINEFKILGEFIEKSFNQISSQLDSEIKISAQVAHDVRSPLSALEVGIKSLPATLEESKRVLLRDAVQNIKDITNNLEKNCNYARSNDERHLTQIAVLLDGVISERRLTLPSYNLTFNQGYESDTYGFFIEIVPSMMRRILTNVINNSYEAIKNKNGVIGFNLYEVNNMCVISIVDNGSGISDAVKQSIFKRGFTTKKDGKGLGLHHAKETLAEWGADIDIDSHENGGAEVKISIPISLPPLWFVSKLSLNESEVIVCIDDNHSIAQTWIERFSHFELKKNFLYCASMDVFLNEINQLKYRNATYLIDFEFTGKPYQGYDFINLILMLRNPKNRIFLVTSRSSEVEMQNYCIMNSIHIIPKNFAVKIPVNVFDKNINQIILRSMSEKSISFLSKPNQCIYFNINDFIADIPYFNSNQKIYIQNSTYTEYLSNKLKKHGLVAILFDYVFELNKI